VANHAGYYVAVAKGYYKAAGLEVSIIPGQGSSQVVQQVATGNDTFGNANSSAIINGRAGGAMVKAVANYSADADAGITVRADSGITTAEQLKGKTIASGTGSVFTAFLPIVWKSAGLAEGDVTIQAVSASASIPLLVRGQIDGFVGNCWSEGPTLELEFDTETNCIRFSDYDAGFVGSSIIASEETIASDPEMVRAFVEASIEGWRYAFANPEEAGQIVAEASAGLEGATPAEAIAVAQPVLKESAVHESTKGMPYGSMSEVMWQDTIDKMTAYLGLENAPAAADLFTNEFVPEGPPLE
jgi:NitT/TauT family transport system substrate-binding protein